MFFSNRTAAGRELAGELARLGPAGPVVLGLPRGGVPVAAEVARLLGAPLDVIVVRKLGVPFQPEVAFGAIGEGGVRLINGATVRAAGLGERDCARVEEAERAELERRQARYRRGREQIPLTGRTVVVVDDGIATGSTASVACQVAREHGAEQVILAVPVAAPQALEQLRREADEVVCLSVPRHFSAVGQWYEDFSQVGDEEVAALLAEAARARPPAPAQTSGRVPPRTGEVVVDAGGTALPGLLTVPEGAAAALLAAAEPRSDIAAIVSRGGRPDLAVSRLAAVCAPTLLIVGGADDQVLDLNRQAVAHLRCEHQMGVVPGATHLFEEPGALDAVADAALDWLSAISPTSASFPTGPANTEKCDGPARCRFTSTPRRGEGEDAPVQPTQPRPDPSGHARRPRVQGLVDARVELTAAAGAAH